MERVLINSLLREEDLRFYHVGPKQFKLIHLPTGDEISTPDPDTMTTDTFRWYAFHLEEVVLGPEHLRVA